MKTQLNNKPYLKHFRKKLRNNGTSAEACLWRILKGRQVGGLKFRRPHSFNNYILDFYCPEIRLAIELDGAYHFTQEGQESDQIRDKYLNSYGIHVLRYENKWVFEQADQIVEEILKYKKENSSS